MTGSQFSLLLLCEVNIKINQKTYNKTDQHEISQMVQKSVKAM